MNKNKTKVNNPEDAKVNVKVILAGLWAAHFLLWTFGDAISLMQGISKPAEDNLLLFVAIPTAIAQAGLIFLSLTGTAKVMRWVSILAALVFAVFNLGFLVDAHTGWQYLLGTAYLLFNALVIRYAWQWKSTVVPNTPVVEI
ncbi:hypothetical protein Dform_00249 [Dehalogenimonas formicexedens]|uniref:DoxX-like family protein n=1 Tax=Dehalogenimonas formicexedens TaxID=1839801 RepID=A0A1P8F5J5_9CHLR|nr:hypothetical protein [Dehalogenimonas formicexedens]APV43612.1 hypothetical protein Dform_00249 [Dehalogenimonas formicexedens]